MLPVDVELVGRRQLRLLHAAEVDHLANKRADRPGELAADPAVGVALMDDMSFTVLSSWA